MDIFLEHTPVDIIVGNQSSLDIGVAGCPKVSMEVGGLVSVDVAVSGQPNLELLFDSFQMDTELSLASDNAVANYVIANEFAEVAAQLTQVEERVEVANTHLTRLMSGIDISGSIDNKIHQAVKWGTMD
jgi:hypothetical protein